MSHVATKRAIHRSIFHFYIASASANGYSAGRYTVKLRFLRHQVPQPVDRGEHETLLTLW